VDEMLSDAAVLEEKQADKAVELELQHRRELAHKLWLI
jgi:hypothetical protein